MFLKQKNCKMPISNCLSGKISIVTGAASGIGLAICRKFAAEGSKLMMVDSNKTALHTAQQELSRKFRSNDVFTMHGDVSKVEFATEVMHAVTSSFGKSSTVLINNAGIVDTSSIVSMTDEQFKRVVEVNLTGTFFFIRSFLQQFSIDQKIKCENKSVNASIVNISSLAGKLGMHHNANYAAAKSGVIGLTKTVCLELGKYGIRCNAVLPGFVETPMIESATSSYLKVIKQLNPTKRLGTVEEIANACLFLASNESSYVNGACLEVTGGFGA